jgi:hypothetical protein
MQKDLIGALAAALLVACASNDERPLSSGTSSSDEGALDDVTNTGSAGDSDSSTDFEEGDSGGRGDVGGCTSMDILFVIDDSGSMGEEQENLKENFPKFIEVLEGYETPNGEPLGYRVGVTTIGILRTYLQNGQGMTSDFGGMSLDDGRLLGQQTCGFAEPWIDGPGGHVLQSFDCVATVGLDGTVVEMPFAVVEEALGAQSLQSGPNEGFYRAGEDSLLVVVIITDEDDCSIENGGKMFVSATGASDCDESKSVGLYPPTRTKAFLDDLTGGPGRYVVVAIAAKEQCQSQFGKADKAKRLADLVELCGDNGFFGDICSGDLWIALKEAVDKMQVACRDLPPVV